MRKLPDIQKLRSALLCLAVLPAIALAACSSTPAAGGDPDGDSTAPPARPAAEVLPELDSLLPGLLEATGPGTPLQISDAKEESCLDLTQDEDWNTLTRTMASVDGRYADHSSAQAAMDAFKVHLEKDGWALEDELHNDENNNGVVSEAVFHKDDLSFAGRYDHAASDGRRFVELILTSPCVENADDHRMVRSSLDPEYGAYSQHYDYNAEKDAGSPP